MRKALIHAFTALFGIGGAIFVSFSNTLPGLQDSTGNKGEIQRTLLEQIQRHLDRAELCIEWKKYTDAQSELAEADHLLDTSDLHPESSDFVRLVEIKTQLYTQLAPYLS